ncbi:Zinc finger protein 26 [Folsomia candida]|uniref:Zinc finger protein 26 n=1 Tax=Folsomia candida TaxID=158441 RepID=A0A226E9Z0_FOLCA|nr:Zinc finger protein 26 [Folsomia candida]
MSRTFIENMSNSINVQTTIKDKVQKLMEKRRHDLQHRRTQYVSALLGPLPFLTPQETSSLILLSTSNESDQVTDSTGQLYMMSSSKVCLICSLDLVQSPPFIDDEKNPGKIRISTLSKLLVSAGNRLNICTEIDGNENCDLCPVCAPVISEIEQVRGQIAVLEGKIGAKLGQIRETILSSRYVDDEVMQIREFILRVIGENEEKREYNFTGDEFPVKVEPELNYDNDLGRGEDDQFLPDDFTYSPPENLVESEDRIKLEDLEDDDSSFCITPHSQKRGRGRPKKYGKAVVPRKRKREDWPSPPPSQKQGSSKIPRKFQSRPLEPTRSSTRTRKTVLKPSQKLGKKMLTVSLTRLPKIRKPTPKPYKCSSCAQSFIAESALTRHLGRAHGIIPCPACPATFSSSKEKDDHVRSAHHAAAPFQCALCGNKFRRRNKLAIHMVVHHEIGEKTFSCGKCGKKFVLEENFNRHVTLHDLEQVKPIVCEVCDSRFEDEERLATHHETHHDAKSKYRCSYCGTGCTSKNNLNRHIRTHTREKPEKCDQCGETFMDRLTLERHVVREHVGTKSHTCHVCGQAFYLQADLRTHLYIHEGKLQVKCETCGEMLPNKNAHQAHRVKVHGEDPFVCEVCVTLLKGRQVKGHGTPQVGTRWKGLGEGIRNIYTLWGLKPLPDVSETEEYFRVFAHLLICKLPIYCCVKFWATQNSSSFSTFRPPSNKVKEVDFDLLEGNLTFVLLLKIYNVSKNDEKISEGDCAMLTVCHTLFFSTKDLKTHMTSHSDERPFPCPHCEKSFKTRSTRGQHVKHIHNANFVLKTPHKCVHCGKEYPRKSYLEGHVRSAHTGERPFVCTHAQCGKGFVLETMLTEHLKVAHGLGRVGKERLPRSKREVVGEEGGH